MRALRWPTPFAIATFALLLSLLQTFAMSDSAMGFGLSSLSSLILSVVEQPAANAYARGGIHTISEPPVPRSERPVPWQASGGGTLDGGFVGAVESPGAGDVVAGNVVISGWAVSAESLKHPHEAVKDFRVYMDGPEDGAGKQVRILLERVPRPDLEEEYGSHQYAESGFSLTLDGSDLSTGPHVIWVYASADGVGSVMARIPLTLLVADPRPPGAVALRTQRDPRVRYIYHSVAAPNPMSAGVNASEEISALIPGGAKRIRGLTLTRLGWEGVPGRDAHAVANIEVHLPEWMPPAGTNPNIISEWRDYYVARADSHETYHAQLYLSYLPRIDRDLQRAPTAEDATGSLKRWSKKIEEWQSAYDEVYSQGERVEGLWTPYRG